MIKTLFPPLLIDNADHYISNQSWKLVTLPLSNLNLKGLSIWTIVSGKNIYVPREHSIEVINAIKKSGANIKYTLLGDNGHTVWTETYSRTLVY